MKTKRVYLVSTGLLLGLVAAGCQERNPAYIQKAVSDAAPPTKDTPADAVEDGPSPSDTLPPPADVPGPDVSVPGNDAAADGSIDVTDAGLLAEVASPDARDAAVDTRDVRRPDADTGPDAPSDLTPADVARDFPVPPDVGAEVLPPPLDAGTPPDVIVAVDLPPLCQEQDTRACSSQGNPLIGACVAGVETCTGGTWGPCTGEILPASAELCNGIDDNCNGMMDEGCAEDCVVVAPNGDDAIADGSADKPFATLAAAMAMANAQDGGPPKRVCVAGGPTCDDQFAYVMDAPLVMASGGRVQGNYALASSGLSYCASTQPPTTTLQFAASEQGVVFNHDVVLPAELSGFVIDRFSPASGSAAAGPISAVQVGGAVGVTLSGIFVTDAPTADTTYGVDIESGGQVTIVGSSISSGQGRSAAIGVYVNGGSVSLRNNCDLDTSGSCNATCGAGGSVLGIRGRAGSALTTTGTANSSAVYVTAASPATSSIALNSLCGGPGSPADGVRGANVATLRCESGACAIIAGNSIFAGSGRQTIALNLLGGGSLVEGNLIQSGCGTDTATGVVLDNASARLQNNRILGGQCPAGSSATFLGLHVLFGNASGEMDVNSNDIEPMGGTGDCQSSGVAMERAQGDGASTGILRNNIISAGNCRTRYGVQEFSNAEARIVENNDLYPGPASTAADAVVLYHRGNFDAQTAIQVNGLAGSAKNISVEPRYVSYPTPIDLHLLSNSLCIDTGTSEGAPSTDADGHSRPAGAGFDIGAYEFSSQ